MCYQPIIQSGGNYQLTFDAGSDDNFLQSGAIVCSLGVRYKSYCANISRTLLIDSSFEIQQNYNFIQDIEREILIRLVPGAKLNEIYESILKYVNDRKKSHLIDYLSETFGSAIGMEFNKSSLIIGPKCTAIVEENMVFNVSIGLNGHTDKKGNAYALFHSNTVIVNESSPATVLTPPPYLNLITDCWRNIFDYLPTSDTRALGETCEHMSQITSDYFSFKKIKIGIRIKLIRS